MPSILRILYVFEIPLFSQIVFAYEKRYCIFDILLPSFNHLHSATTEVGNERMFYHPSRHLVYCGGLHLITIYNPQIEMFARFKMKSSFHKTKRII